MDEYSRFLDELKQKADIVDIVSQYSQVTRKGAYYFACCPLHVEKTPSFCMYPSTNTYYCYGCHEKGDAIKFIEEIEKTDFKGAVEILAKKYNMEIPTFKSDNSIKEAKKKRDRLHALMRDAALHYHNNLMSEKGKVARDYLASRGFTQDTITKFGLGYSIDKFELPNFLKSKGYTYEEMAEAQVAYPTAKVGAYDPQNGRFVIPVINSTKNVVAFAGRVIGKVPDGVAKYYNSKASFIFNKSNELFGQHVVKTLRNVNDVVLVEGHLDVISLYQAGIQNAVASMGTALTPEQAHLIKRYAKKVYFMYDGDAAGQNGMLRGVDILRKEDLEVKVVVLDKNQAKDPDEFINKFGAQAMKDKIYATAIPMYEYKINNVAKDYNFKSPEERGEFATKAIECIKDIQSKAQAEPLINYIQSKSGINSSVLFDLFASVQKGQQIAPPKVSTKLENDNYTKALRYIIYAAYGGVDGVTVDDEYAECITNSNLRELYDNFRVHEGELTLEDLEEYRETNPEVAEITNAAMAIGDAAAKQYFKDARKLVLVTFFEEKRTQLSLQLESVKNQSELNDLVVQIDDINKYIKSIKQGKTGGLNG
ncbi:MAG: DNA primase [Clostridia bacterium]|nr:DNA primase [Clostridia bacterium]